MSAAEPIPLVDPGKALAVNRLMVPLMELMDRKDVTEVTINRPGEAWAKTFVGWERHSIPALSLGYLEALTRSIIVYNGMQVRPSNSVVLPDGQRGQIIMPPAVLDGTISMSIRKHSSTVRSLEELTANGAFEGARDVSINRPTEAEVAAALARGDFQRLEPFEAELLAIKRSGDMARFLEACVLAKRNIVIAGKTGSGKTTLARSVIEKVPFDERIVTIEDVHELFMRDVPNKVHLFYARDDEGGSRVTPKQALASCLRMKPDRILLAELRGDEAWEFIKSINTGHPGSISTMHANGAFEAFEQLTAFIKDSKTGSHLDTDYIKHRLFTTIDVVLFYDKWKLREIYYEPENKRKQLG